MDCQPAVVFIFLDCLDSHVGTRPEIYLDNTGIEMLDIDIWHKPAVLKWEGTNRCFPLTESATVLRFFVRYSSVPYFFFL